MNSKKGQNSQLSPKESFNQEDVIEHSAYVDRQNHNNNFNIRINENKNTNEMKNMSLITRFIGSVIDKLILIIIFIAIFISIFPYSSSRRIGTYVGLIGTSTDNYELIDKVQIHRYNNYNFKEHTAYENLGYLEMEAPDFGTTLEWDMKISFAFILLNIVYYLIFETLISASIGKSMFGGFLINNKNKKIDFDKAFLRGICRGVMMAGLYSLLHLLLGICNIITIAILLLMDWPCVFIAKKSLLDLYTKTTYVRQ